MRTIWLMPGWLGLIIGPSPSGTDTADLPGLLKQMALKCAAVVRLWIQRRRQRLDLADLPAYRLQDLGLDWHAVQREVHKPFWVK